MVKTMLLPISDLLFGWPSINHGDVDAKLMEERLRFITCELSVKSSHRKRVMDFWDAYEQLMCHPRDTFLHQTETKHPPYRFITPARIPIDLRLHNSMLLDRCLAVINGLRQPTRVGWFQDFKETTIARLRDEGKSLQEVKRLVRQDGLREYASRLFDAMRQNAALQSISDGIAEPLIQQATFSLILAEAKEAFATDWLTYQEQADHELRRTHGHLYHIAEWRQRRMGELEEQYLEAHKYDIHEMVLSKCMQSGLEQHAFFISRDLTFLRDFIFRVPAQLLRHWRVYRRVVSYTTSYEMVDTVLLSRRPSRNEPVPPIKRSIKCAAARDPSYELINVPYARKPPRTDQEFGPQDFEVHTASPKRVFRQVDVSYLDIDGEDEAGLVSKPLLTSTVTENKITIPFRSAFSLTALVKPGPIYLRLELDQATGYLFYNKSFYQDTIISRIIRIWRNIRASRRAFDATPSKGLLDKAAARPLHRIWSYLFRGFFSTLLILVIWPPLCLLVSSLSILLGLTLPLTVPLISLLLHFSGVLFWDAYKPASKPNRLFPIVELIFGHFLVRFLLQTILAFLAAFIFCPVWAVIRLVWAFVRCITRSIWDALVFHLVLRRLARVPAREDFMVKRIAGPGTAANHFYRARPVDILVVLVGQLELLELSLWRRQMEQLADKPIDAYRRLVQSLSWLCLTPQSDGKLYTTLCQKTKLWRSEIQSNTEERIQALQLHLKPNQLQRIKLSDRDLHHTLRMGAELTECFFQNRIAARLDLLQQDLVSWWSAFSLNTDDYLGELRNRLECPRYI
ncbi:solute carrier family 13 (sodium-dependent dicarboxylate transporter) member 2/3/5 [Clonorchis sinensis]|uniref:Solute carrier family 13 (Sodium-dependent dicarboxylate transporter) member 2/3/5 n=1 Tax=Clonorchis sinensis TaxID=79923 RepID=G7Y5L4_CLOSI|nr:solute carrier family 13 (sodium-dependent dicarboxylate transporter) member 2/3/5 [Clonorchis sinensis]